MAKKDLLKRTVSGVVFLAVIIAGLIVWPPLMPLIVLISIDRMFEEFYSITVGKSFAPQRWLAIFTVTCLFLLNCACVFFSVESRWMFMALIPFVAMLISVLFLKDRSSLDKFAYVFEGMLYIGVPVVLLPLLFVKDGGYDGYLMLSFLAIMCCSDTGAYLFGTLFGQKETSRKLAPSISPKKSWVGFWSGIIYAVAASVIVRALGWIDMPLVHSIAFAVCISSAGVCGDLFESVIKRHFGVKDSGNSIPGHGGFLDRFDSTLFAIPVAIAYLYAFNLL